MSCLPRALQMAQRSPQTFDFSLVRIPLTLEAFKHFQHFVHLVETFPKRPDDVIDLVNGLLNTALLIRAPRVNGGTWHRTGFLGLGGRFGFGSGSCSLLLL